MCLMECHVAWHMYFMDSGEYISPLSSEPACTRKRLFSVEGDCLMSSVMIMISRRVMSVLSPQAWTHVV